MNDFFRNVLRTEHGMILVLCLMIFLLVRALLRSNKSAVSKINLEDALLGEDEKLSRAAIVMLGSFILSSWIVVYVTLGGAMTAELFGLYCAVWATPAVTKLIVNRPPIPSAQTVVTSTTVGQDVVPKTTTVTTS